MSPITGARRTAPAAMRFRALPAGAGGARSEA